MGDIKLAQQIYFVVKYLFEKAPEVISESLKLKVSRGSLSHTSVDGHVPIHMNGAYPSLFRHIPVLAPLVNFSECSTVYMYLKPIFRIHDGTRKEAKKRVCTLYV